MRKDYNVFAEYFDITNDSYAKHHSEYFYNKAFPRFEQKWCTYCFEFNGQCIHIRYSLVVHFYQIIGVLPYTTLFHDYYLD